MFNNQLLFKIFLSDSMKVIFKSLLFIVSIFGLAHCKVEEDPESALKTWLSLIDNGKFEEAKKLSTENGQYLVNVLSKISETGEKNEHNFQSLSCRVINDSAVCKFSYEEGIFDSLYLKKVSGKWLYGGNYEELDQGLDEFFDEIFEETTSDTTAIF